MIAFKDKIFTGIIGIAAAISGAIALLIFIFLLTEAYPFVAKVGIQHFFTDTQWAPTLGRYDMMPMLAGTILVAIGAVILAAPLGILSGVYSFFFATPSRAVLYRRAIELLAGIPSVVYGFWGLVILVPWINSIHPPGASLLAGILVLAIMIFPTLALSVDASFASVPKVTIDAARALGFGPWGILRLALLPAAKGSLITGAILQTGRAIGETMAVIMVCGNIVQFPRSLFMPIRTLSANMALEMAYAMNDHRAALFTSGLLLMIVIVVLVFFGGVMQRAKSLT